MSAFRKESLRELLARVHERLNQAHAVDPETRGLLVTLMKDIERALGSGTDREPVANVDRTQLGRESLASLEGLAARFDVEHPALGQTLRQLVDLLGKAGI